MKRLRLAVFRSNKYIYAQIIDDDKEHTLVAASDKDIEKKIKSRRRATRIEKAHTAGKILAEKALKKKIKNVYFDRRDYKYHGRVKALAEGAREGGLNF